MFDLVAGTVAHVPNRQTMPIVASSVVESILLATIAIGSVLAAGALPEVAPMMAFVAEMPAIAPPPPPPPPSQSKPVPVPPPTNVAAAPLEVPLAIEPEPLPLAAEEGVFTPVEAGIVGGVVGNMPAVVETPPPPPAPAPAPAIRRIGGDLKVPALIHRVEPIYPVMAQASHVSGIVLLDAIVDESGLVKSLTVIKGHPLLAPAAIEAVKQWQYAPLLLNGNPIPFELTVTLRFSLVEG